MDCEALTLLQYRFRYPGAVLKCALCNTADEPNNHLLGFRHGEHSTLVHEGCLQHTNIVKKESLVINGSSAMTLNTIFDIIKLSKTCYQCKRSGATIKCEMELCMKHYHYRCCSEWNFNIAGALFFCRDHRHLQVRPQKSAPPINVAIRKCELTASSHHFDRSIAEPIDGATYPLNAMANNFNLTSPLEDSSVQRADQRKSESRTTMNSAKQSSLQLSASIPYKNQLKSKGDREGAYGTQNIALTAKAMRTQESSTKSPLNKHVTMLAAVSNNRENESLPETAIKNNNTIGSQDRNMLMLTREISGAGDLRIDTTELSKMIHLTRKHHMLQTKIMHDLFHEGALTCDKNAVSGNGGGRNRRRNYGPSNDCAISLTAEDTLMQEFSKQETTKGPESTHERKRLGTFDVSSTSGNNIIITNDDSGHDPPLKSIEPEDQGISGGTYQSISKDDDDEDWDEEESSSESDEEEGSALFV